MFYFCSIIKQKITESIALLELLYRHFADKYMCSSSLLVLFQYKFHQKGSMSQYAAFALSSSKKHLRSPNFHFPLILLSVKLNLNFYTSHLSSILFSLLIADFIFANLFAHLLLLIHQEITLVFYFNSGQKMLYFKIYFLLYYIIF